MGGGRMARMPVGWAAKLGLACTGRAQWAMCWVAKMLVALFGSRRLPYLLRGLHAAFYLPPPSRVFRVFRAFRVFRVFHVFRVFRVFRVFAFFAFYHYLVLMGLSGSLGWVVKVGFGWGSRNKL